MSTITNELKKQAAEAKRAAKAKIGKPKLVKWQTGKYTYKWVTIKQAKAWGAKRSAAKTKELREARKTSRQIKKSIAVSKKLSKESWVLDWDNFPSSVKRWNRNASDNWLTQNEVFDNDNIDVVDVFWYVNPFIGPDEFGHDNEEFLDAVQSTYPEEWKEHFGNTTAGSQDKKYYSGKLEEKSRAYAEGKARHDMAGRSAKPTTSGPFTESLVDDYSQDFDLSMLDI